MERSDKMLLRNMIKVMIVYGIVIQGILFFLPVAFGKASIGLWIGIAAGCGMLIHMRNTLNEALDLGAEEAQKQVQKAYAIRTTAIVALCFAGIYFDLVNMVTLLIGIMGVKISAFAQPLMDSFKKKNQ